MTLDPTTNFAKTTLDVPAGGYATGDTSISVTDASEFPDPSTDGEYNIVVWDITQGSAADASTREIMRVTGLSTNTFTVTRGQESTSAQSYSENGTYRVILAPTAKMFSDIDTGFQTLSSSDNHVESFTGDLNNHLQGIVFADTGHSNSPNGNNGICRAYSLDDNNCMQEFTEIGADKTYYRRKSVGTWQNWKLLVAENDSPTFGSITLTPGGGETDFGITQQMASSTARAQNEIQDETGAQLWRYGKTGEGDDAFRWFNGSVNVLEILHSTGLTNFANMPTVGGDDIAESGSNSDGNWVKYADGTMECWHDDIDITISGDLSLMTGNWTFPEPFNATPVVNLILNHDPVDWDVNGDRQNISMWGYDSTGTSSVSFRLRGQANFSGDFANNNRATAIGTWK